MAVEIKEGMAVRCLNCGKPIKVAGGESLITGDRTEYIFCPNCKKAYGVHIYRMFGENAKEGDGKCLS